MLEKIVVISFIVFAIYATMKEGMIFGKVNDWWDNATKKWSVENREYWSKPLFSCPVCMAVWYGSAAYWIIYGNSWQEWLIVIISSMGMNCILSELFPKDD